MNRNPNSLKVLGAIIPKVINRIAKIGEGHLQCFFISI
jgi:hypothetical protein